MTYELARKHISKRMIMWWYPFSQSFEILKLIVTVGRIVSRDPKVMCVKSRAETGIKLIKLVDIKNMNMVSIKLRKDTKINKK